ncbi:MAG: VanZ family protein [Flavobacteriales bacterium]
MKVLIVLYGIIMLGLYLYPGRQMMAFDEERYVGIRGDYFLHFCAFIPYSMMFIHYAFLRKKNVLLYALLALSSASMYELIHLFIPDRSFNLFDALSNAIGASLGLILYFVLVKMRVLDNASQ